MKGINEASKDFEENFERENDGIGGEHLNENEGLATDKVKMIIVCIYHRIFNESRCFLPAHEFSIFPSTFTFKSRCQGMQFKFQRDSLRGFHIFCRRVISSFFVSFFLCLFLIFLLVANKKNRASLSFSNYKTIER